MRDLRSRFGNLWIQDVSTPIESLEVTATSGGTVQVCLGVRVHADRNHSWVLDELLLELDVAAVNDLGKKLAVAACQLEKDKAVTGLYNPN